MNAALWKFNCVQHKDLAFMYCEIITTISLVNIHHLTRPSALASSHVVHCAPIAYLPGSLHPLSTFTQFPSPPSLLGTTNLLALSVNLGPCHSLSFFFLDPTYEWDHAEFVFFFLNYFTCHYHFTHVVANGRIFLFFMAE